VSCERARLIVDPLELDPGDAHVQGCADCQAQLAALRRITHAMRDVGARSRRAPDHLARVWAAVEQRPARNWLPIAGAGTVLVAAAAALVLWLRKPDPPQLAIDVIAGDGAAIRGDARVGDRLRIRARDGDAIHVRVYRNDRHLVLECPRMCTRDDGSMRGELVLEIARYQVLWLDGPTAPPTGSVDGDIAAATQAGARHELRELEVR
jgi:hypothetical protein